MFGPNHTPSIHHREPAFEKLWYDTRDAFYRAVNLDPRTWDVFFVTGSGTCAMETLLHSVRVKGIYVHGDGHFAKRWDDLVNQMGRRGGSQLREDVATCGVLYETSESSHRPADDGSDVLDCVSAFPYYMPTKSPAWCSVTSKQFGCSPGLSFVVVRKDLWVKDFFKPMEPTYMSLAKYKAKAQYGQTPNTPAISLLEEFKDKLESFSLENHRNMIDRRREYLTKLLGSDTIKGTGPVLTLNNTPRVCAMQEKFNLYNNSSDGPQIFLWSGTDEQYQELYNWLKDNP